jgi:hypothetical protein
VKTFGEILRPILGSRAAPRDTPAPTGDTPPSFGDARDVLDHLVGDRERGLTLREMRELHEHGPDGVQQVDPETVGFTDRDWGSDSGSRPRRRTRRVPYTAMDPETVLWTSSVRLRRGTVDPATGLATGPAEDAELVTVARAALSERLAAHVETHGLVVLAARWSGTAGGPGLFDDATVRLEAQLEVRHDGVWGEIRRAMAEDAADRLEAAQEAAEAPDPPF